jgi:histidine triad (HIT) family protein
VAEVASRDGEARHAECVFCERAARPGALTRRSVFEDARFLVTHQANEDGPTSYLGALLLQTKRHVPNLGELTDTEAMGLGQLLARTSAALIRCTGAEWTYTFSFTEAFRHVHFVVAARYAGLPQRYYRLGFADWPAAPRGSLTEVEALAARLREEIARDRTLPR